MKFGIVVFPGSNCDRDAFHVCKEILGREVVTLWHKETGRLNCDCVILPGGFSYGDYLRSGSIAATSPILRSVADFAKKGGLVIGICNGFQILTEVGLLPGALMRNSGLQFVCKDIYLKVETSHTPFTLKYAAGDVLKIPIAHMDGSYVAEEDVLQSLGDHQQIIFRYCSEKGEVDTEANPNGSLKNIAGICNKERNVLGMMPHPERASEEELGSVDGRDLFESIVRYIEK